jgi:hypothetical protein
VYTSNRSIENVSLSSKIMGFVCTMEDLMQRNIEHEYIVIIYQIYFVQGLERSKNMRLTENI